ncbi:MAG: rhamnogalacturonan lyase [Pirellulaceae bacterium]|nr:rhamnogalacturonan lyase [Pirellulaceae bacterium]
MTAWLFRTVLAAVILAGTCAAGAERQMEHLTRGVIAVPREAGDAYVGWRMLGTDPDGIAFNLYRSTDNRAPIRLNAQPITASTNFVDQGVDRTSPNAYFVRPVIEGREQAASEPYALSADAPARQYLEIPLKTPEGYSPGDTSVGDLDGDGQYELVVHMTGRGRDNSQDGFTDPPILHAYKLDGTQLWSIHLGRNIREGAHYTQFLVYDLDGDGIAEVACKTADGTVDGTGVVIGDEAADHVGRDGKILRGPEYLSVFDGRTGAALATVEYIPTRGDIGGWGGIGGNAGNDRSGNRVDRFLACVAYLDGQRPSVVMCRGVYGRSVLAAWDWRDGKLTSRWVFDTAAPGTGRDGKPNADYAGMGGHSVSVADVDGDGRDEIIYHAMVVDDDGRGLFTTGFRHGDALHVSRFDPTHPNPVVFGIHENEGSRYDATTPAVAAFDAKTGQTIWRLGDGADAGRALAADIDPRYAGAEMWGGPSGLRTCRGELIGPAPRSANFAIWWDGDLLREILDRTTISKWDWNNARLNALFTADGCASNNGTKATPALTADLFGDWREEVVFRTLDNQRLRIHTTSIPTEHRLPTLMHDPQYRLSVAWQNVGYNQPPHTGFFLGHAMPQPPRPAITTTARAAVRPPDDRGTSDDSP